MNIGDTLEYNFKSWEVWLVETIDGINFYHLREIGNLENGIRIESIN